MTKKQLAYEVIERLKTEYPDAGCTLDYDDAWKLLVSVRLAAQCTDARVNVIVPQLFDKYPSIEALADADIYDIEKIVRPCGLSKSKARDISGCMRMLHTVYNNKVPDTLEELLKLPGVGRKTANVVMLEAFNKPQGIAIDTHAKRLSNRIGLSAESDPKKIEQDLVRQIPREYFKDVNHLFMWHGRNTCTARSPICEKCTIRKYCKTYNS